MNFNTIINCTISKIAHQKLKTIRLIIFTIWSDSQCSHFDFAEQWAIFDMLLQHYLVDRHVVQWSIKIAAFFFKLYPVSSGTLSYKVIYTLSGAWGPIITLPNKNKTKTNRQTNKQSNAYTYIIMLSCRQKHVTLTNAYDLIIFTTKLFDKPVWSMAGTKREGVLQFE